MELSSYIKKRRTIRKFKNRELSQDLINKLIENAIYAPSACNMQAWKFIVIQSKNKMEEMVKFGATTWITNAPCGILVIYRNDISVNSSLYKDHYQSSAAAIQNILLEATELELATCWVCDLPRPKLLKKIFNIPKYFDIIAYIAIGYPDTDCSRLSVNHYHSLDDFKFHTRKYSLDQVMSYDSFSKIEKDCTQIPAKRFLFIKRFLLKRRFPFGFLFTDHMLKEKHK